MVSRGPRPPVVSHGVGSREAFLDSPRRGVALQNAAAQRRSAPSHASHVPAGPTAAFI